MIVTVPLLLLKKGRLKFTPALPPRKDVAISNLGAGLIEKVNYQNFFAILVTKKFGQILDVYFRHFIF